MKNTLVISGFPGVGKSYFFNSITNLTTLDSDSFQFSWIKDEDGNNTKTRNPDFPNNYMQHIKDNIGKVDIIFVSSHKVVRDALRENNINYIIAYPDKSLKYEYIIKYVKRGNDANFIKFICENWDDFIDDIENETYSTKLKLWKNEYLGDILNKEYCPTYEEFCNVEKTNADEYEGNICCRCKKACALLKTIKESGEIND